VTDASSLLPGLEEQWIEHRGARMRLFAGGTELVAGGAPPLLLIHGYGGAAWNFVDRTPSEFNTTYSGISVTLTAAQITCPEACT